MTTTTQCSLFELIQVVGEFSRTENEIMAAVTDLINSGKIQLTGQLTGAQVDLSS